jgi:hypothetical protein
MYEQAMDILDRISQADELHGATALLAAVRRIAPRVPSGPQVLVTTSVEGIALAGAVIGATGRSDVTWELADLAAPASVPSGGNHVIIDSLDPGCGWLEALVERYPGATLLTADPDLEYSNRLAA